MSNDATALLAAKEDNLAVAERMMKRIIERVEKPNGAPLPPKQLTQALLRVHSLLLEKLQAVDAEVEEKPRQWEEKAKQLPQEPNGKRQRFLLRAVATAFEVLLNDRDLSREILIGFDMYIEKLFGTQLYDKLNEEARVLIGPLTSGSQDPTVWKTLLSDPRFKRFTLSLLFRINSKFLAFDRAQLTMTTIIMNNLPKGKRFDRSAFMSLFKRLLDPLREELKTEEGIEYLEFTLGPTASYVIEEVCTQFEAWMGAA